MFKRHQQNSSKQTSQSTPSPKMNPTALSKEETQSISQKDESHNRKLKTEFRTFSNAFRLNLKPSSPFVNHSSSDLDPVFLSDGHTTFIMDRQQTQKLKAKDSKECGHKKSGDIFDDFWEAKVPHSKDSGPYGPTCSLENMWNMWSQETLKEDFFSKQLSPEEMQYISSRNKRKSKFNENVRPTFLNVNLLTPNSKICKSVPKLQEFLGVDEELQQEDIFHDAYDDLQGSCGDILEENIDKSSDYEDASGLEDEESCERNTEETANYMYEIQPEAGDVIGDNFVIQKRYDENCNDVEIQQPHDNKDEFSSLMETIQNMMQSMNLNNSIQRTDQLLPNAIPYSSTSFTLKDCFSKSSRFCDVKAPVNPFVTMWSTEIPKELKSDSMEHFLRLSHGKYMDIDMAMGDKIPRVYSSKASNRMPNVRHIFPPRLKLQDLISCSSIGATTTSTGNFSNDENNSTSDIFKEEERLSAGDAVSSGSKSLNCIQNHQENFALYTQDKIDQRLSMKIASKSPVSGSFTTSLQEDKNKPSCLQVTSLQVENNQVVEKKPLFRSTEESEFRETEDVLVVQPQLIHFYDDCVHRNRTVLLYTQQALNTVCKEFTNAVSSSKIWNKLSKKSMSFGATKIRGIVDIELTNRNPRASNKSTKLWKRYRKSLKTVILMIDLVSGDKMKREQFINSRFLRKFRAFAKHDCSWNSGFVITKSQSNLWLAEAGLYNDGKLDPSFASNYFEQYAGRRLVINPYDYMLYLVKIAYKSGIDIDIMYDRMIASELPPAKHSAHKHSRTLLT